MIFFFGHIRIWLSFRSRVVEDVSLVPESRLEGQKLSDVWIILINPRLLFHPSLYGSCLAWYAGKWVGKIWNLPGNPTDVTAGSTLKIISWTLEVSQKKIQIYDLEDMELIFHIRFSIFFVFHYVLERVSTYHRSRTEYVEVCNFSQASHLSVFPWW